MSSFGERLRELRDAAGLSRAELAAKISGVSEGAIRNLEQGESKEPKWETVLALADALGISVAEFTVKASEVAEKPGRGRPRKTAVTTVSRSATIPGGIEIPLAGVVAAGAGSLEEFIGATINAAKRFAGCVAYQVRGNSMIDENVITGDYVIVRQQPEAQPGEVVVAWIEEVGAVIKVFKGQGLLTSGDDEEEWTHVMRDGDRILGVRVGLIRFS